MIALLTLVALLGAAPVAEHGTITLSPTLVQHGLLFRSSHASAGGIGGGAGVQLEYGPHWLAQLDGAALLGFGNAGVVRLAAGLQRARWYAPAGWATLHVLFGHRMEFLSNDGSSRPAQDWLVGLRGSALRFAGPAGVISLLEPGVGLGVRGGYALELTVMQASLRF